MLPDIWKHGAKGGDRIGVQAASSLHFFQTYLVDFIYRYRDVRYELVRRRR